MKKVLFSFLILLVTAIICYTPTIIVQADTGPKPSLNIKIIGIEGAYYVDLMLDGAVNTYHSNRIYSELREEFLEYADALREFRNANTNRFWLLDGTMVMAFSQNLKLTDADNVTFGYMVPTNFQIVIIKENKDIIVTNAVKRMRFSSNMVIDLTNNLSLVEGQTNIYEFTGNVVEVGFIKDNILGFLYRLSITLLVELLIAIFVFKITKKQAVTIIVIINILTQLLLNIVLLNYTSRALNPLLDFANVFFTLELTIICVEMWAYVFLIKKYSISKLIFYALAANLVTAILTFIV